MDASAMASPPQSVPSRGNICIEACRLTIGELPGPLAHHPTGGRESMSVRPQAKELGVAIIGGGRVGLFRGEVANRHPAVKWVGLAEKNPNRAGEVAPKVGADFVTQSHVELLKPSGGQLRDHRDRRASACRADPRGGRARHSAADREAARDRPRAVREGAEDHQGRRHRRGRRLHAALPPQMARRQGEGAAPARSGTSRSSHRAPS